MPVQIGTAYIPVRADMSSFNRDVSTGADKANGAMAGLGKTMALIGGAAVAGKVKDFLGGAFEQAEEATKVGAQTENVIRSTGAAAGITAKHVGDLATALSNKTAIDDDTIQSGANLLLTFNKVRNEVGEGNNVFDRTVAVANDMAVALGTDISGASIQMGKAMQDPIKGMTALSRAGVSFTAEQKEQVKVLIESGDLLGAQTMVLKEVEAQFQGSAAAQATGTDRLKVTWGNFQETIGLALLPTLEKLLGVLNVVGLWATKNVAVVTAIAGVIGTVLVAALISWTINMTKAGVASAKTAAKTAIDAGKAAASWVASSVRAIASFIATAAASVASWVVMAAASLAGAAAIALSWIIAFGPIALIIAAVVGLAVVIWKNWDTIKEAFQKGADWVYEKLMALVGWFTQLPTRISNAIKGLWTGLTDGFKEALNGIIDLWNNFRIEFRGYDIPGPGPNIPGFVIDTPNIPRFHDGGTFRAPTPGGEGLALLRDGETVSTPGNGGGGGTSVNVYGATDVAALAEQIARTLEWRRLSTAGR